MSELQGLRTTSLIAFAEALEKINERQRQCLLTLDKLNEANNKIISEHSGLPINVVTPRMNELKKKGLIQEIKVDTCPYTGRRTVFYRRVKK
jgi:DNA-binding MarR family transcriptional regulator